MNKTILILSTHFVDEAVISEYKKLRNTKNVDAVLAIDNNAYKYDFQNRIENKIFFGVSVRCFFFDSKLHDELELPYFTHKGEKDFKSVMWHNGDYRFYYVRKFFPDYEYYWQFDYDVFCNAPTYDGFLNKFNDDTLRTLQLQVFVMKQRTEIGFGLTALIGLTATKKFTAVFSPLSDYLQWRLIFFTKDAWNIKKFFKITAKINGFFVNYSCRPN